MGILSWAIFGLIAGWLAKVIMPGKDPGGFFVTILIGVVGGIFGGYIGTLLGIGTVTGFNLMSFVLAIAGAIVLLALYRVVK
nr:GlsB/YeaQ/YmgE family stress response membrane protein [Candidatus Dadabacteria bacterium]NIQ14211.1 GlsB/YeaQ/YmgE family stress response membrane protein [Candidatus Dadabacteria bacterium]